MSIGKAEKNIAPIAGYVHPVEGENVKEIHFFGAFIGTGSQKDVYMAPDSDSRCICLIRADTVGFLSPMDVALKEVKDMQILKAKGLPVVDCHGVIKLGQQYGVEREFIKNALDSQDIIEGKKVLPSDKQFNANVEASCISIIKILEKKNIAIEDLQFLIDSHGYVLINDARSVSEGNPQKGIDKLKELKGFALLNLLDYDSD